MIESPRLALIRTDAVGTAFYDSVMDRIAQRSRKPRGIVLHFAGTCGDELFVVTVYRDSSTRAAMFTDFSGPEIANELHESETRADLTRHELEVKRMLASDELTNVAERPISAPKSALFVVDPDMTTEAYRKAAALANFPDRWPEGLLLHLLFSSNKQMGVFDLWSSKELARPHYENTIAPSTEETLGKKLAEGQFQNGWIELHALTVNLRPDDPLREYSDPAVAGST